MDSEAEIRRYWDAIYRTTSLENIKWEEGAPAAELVALIESGMVTKGPALDIGTGSGTNAVYLAQQGFDCHGIDISSTAIALARQKAAQAGVAVQLTAGNAFELPYPDNSFVFVFDYGCFHNMPVEVRENHIVSVHRALRPGGKYQLICFSDKEPHHGGPPYAFSPADIRRLFGGLFTVINVKEFTTAPRESVHHHLSVLMEKPG